MKLSKTQEEIIIMIKRVFVLGMTALMLVACGGDAGVSQAEFDGKIAELPECPYVSGEATVKVTQKQASASQSRNATFTFAKEGGVWDVASSTGDASDLSSFSTMYMHTVDLYEEAIDTYVDMLDNPSLNYYVKGEGFGLKLTGKIDYSKLVSGGVGGVLDQTLKIDWDKYGMLTKWDFECSGNLEYAGQKVSYSETDLITVSWR